MKSIMFQGTASSVGKTTLAAGVCRVLYQDGLRVVPFKSQNMSTISYTLPSGEEISSAQWLQALACGIEPKWQMNPILLKPVAEAGSEVILAGKSQGRMTARDYYQNKPEYREIVQKAYAELSEDSDIIVIEGAGSSAEINFREGDFVNMGLAQMVQSPVIIVADIDRGGVFASLYGTLKLLSPEDQSLIKGFIINKFRGDVSLLEDTVYAFANDLGIPCLGIVPYFNHNLPEEDSLSDHHTKQNETIEESLDRLAKHVRTYVDMEQLKQIAGLK